MEIVGPAEGVLNKQQIIERFDTEITKMIKASIDPQFEFERQILINQARLNWQFVRGNHYNVPGEITTAYGQIADYLPFDGTQGNEETGPEVKLCPPINVIGGDLYKFMAVMGQQAPRVKAVADDPSDSESLAVAQCADVNVRDLWQKQKVDRKWKLIPFHLYVTGPAYIFTDWNTDRKKYGQTVEPQIEVVTDEEGNPFPQVVGQKAYANGDAELEVYSVLEVWTPFEATTIEGNPLRLELMQSKWALLEKYASKDPNAPGPLEQYRDEDVPDEDYSTSSTAAAEARDATANPSGTGQAKKKNQWRHARYWLPSYMYQAISNPQVREIFQTQFPDGLYVARVGSVTCDIDNRTVEHNWCVCRIGRGERIVDRPIAADSLPIQRAIDDLVGLAIETVLRAITQTIMDSQLIDRQAANTKEAVPAEIILTTLPVDGDIRERIYQIPPVRLGDQVIPLIGQMRAFQQDITGIRPELSGGGPPSQTYHEAKQRRDQALMQLSPQADEMRFACASLAENLIRLRSQFGSGIVKAQRKGAYGVETDIADMAQLKMGGWHTESNDDFPMTLSDRRDAVFSLLKDFPPEVQQALSVLDPLNIEEIFELIQIPGFESVTRDQKEKTLADIQMLLNEQPTPGAPGPDGKPGPDQPSKQPDAFDNHLIAAGVAAVWMVSKTGREAANANPGGFANVVAWWQVQKNLAVPPPPPPPPPVKGSLSVAMKAEDFPRLVPELLQGAGLPAPPPDLTAPQATPSPGAAADMGAPKPVVNAPPPAPEPAAAIVQ